MRNQTQAYFYAAASVLLWSTVATAFKLTLRHVDFVDMLLWSSAFSTLVLFLALALQGKLALLGSIRHLHRSALAGLLSPFLYYMVLFKAYSLLPAQLAQPLNYTWPVTLVVLSIPLLKQRIRLGSLVAVLVSFAGVVVISTEGRLSTLEMRSPLGVALAVGSSVVWALYWILSVRDERDETLKLFLSFAFGFAYVLVARLVMSPLAIPSTRAILGSAYVGLFEMGFTFVLWLRALRLSGTTAQVSILVYFSPFISLLFIHFILGEPILPATIAGLVLIVAGVAIQKHGDAARPPAVSPEI